MKRASLRRILGSVALLTTSFLWANVPEAPVILGDCPEILMVRQIGGVAGTRVSSVHECRTEMGNVELQVSYANSGRVTVFVTPQERQRLQSMIVESLEEARASSKWDSNRICRESVSAESSLAPESIQNFSACDQDPRSAYGHRLLTAIRTLYRQDEAIVRQANGY